MRITEEDIKQDENASKYINLSHYETVLPDIDDMSEYSNIEFFKSLTREETKQVIEFVKRIRNGKRE